MQLGYSQVFKQYKQSRLIKTNNLEGETNTTMVFLLIKYKIDEDKEYTLEDYKVIIPMDKFFDVIK